MSLKKGKVIQPKIHETKENLNLYDGVHILNGCKNVTLSGSAVVLEATDTTFSSITGKARINILHSGEIYYISSKAKIGLIETGYIFPLLATLL